MKRGIALLLAVLLLMCSGCSDLLESDKIKLQFYYRVSNDIPSGNALTSEVKYLDSDSIPAVMEALLEGPYKAGMMRTFPEKVQLNSFALNEGILTLDLSESFGTLSGYDLMLAQYCIVLTVTQLDSVDGVSMTVDGKKVPGGAAGILTPTNVLLTGETQDPYMISSQLYFPTKEGTGMGVEYRMITVESMDAVGQSQGVLDQLFIGPREPELAPCLNGGMMKVSSVQGNVCTITMDEEALDKLISDQATFQLKLYSIVNSLTELDAIDKVVFLLHGELMDGWETQYGAKYDF